MREKIKLGSDFSGVGALKQALKILNKDAHEVFACDMDEYARDTYILNYGEPLYYPKNVYDREIPKDPLDLYVTTPPCQAFSLAGARKGEDDKRGILFYNSLDFIRVNKPRFFLFENVEGLVSHDKRNKDSTIGRTFQKWIDCLGGKSVNNNPVMFPHEDSVPYHIYWKVLNAKKHGTPQNRKRVFIVGIRDDEDNNYKFPKPFHLNKFLKDVLDPVVDEKYVLSEKLLHGLLTHGERHKEKGNGFIFKLADINAPAAGITTKAGSRGTDNFVGCVKIKANNERGYDILTENDSLNYKMASSVTRRGRIGKNVASTLDTECGQAVLQGGLIRKLTPRECFRLMDFPDTFVWRVSDNQAYKQAGNSIPAGLLAAVIGNINF